MEEWDRIGFTVLYRIPVYRYRYHVIKSEIFGTPLLTLLSLLLVLIDLVLPLKTLDEIWILIWTDEFIHTEQHLVFERNFAQMGWAHMSLVKTGKIYEVYPKKFHI